MLKKLMFAACFAAMVLPLAAEVRLASGGKTDYTVISPEKPSPDEKAAAEDLCNYLTRITGAKFTLNGDAPHKIYVGKKAPGDKQQLSDFERRVRAENGDVYLYGSGWQGNTFAVYDFLEKFFDCRWYTFFGDECIPEKREAVFDKLELNVIPSFSFYDYKGGSWMPRVASYERFRRASRVYDWSVARGEAALINSAHTMCMIIPPGVSLGRQTPFHAPYKSFKDKAYFKTNPEFFSLRSGKRVPYFQLCFSNPELRKEFLKNLEIIVKNEYKSGPAQIALLLNDKGRSGDKCCECAECEKLNKKYGSTVGSYWDFILYASRYFKEKYPDIHLLTYGYAITKVPPSRGLTKLPDNVILEMAMLSSTDFLKPYRDTPEIYDDFKRWAALANKRLSWWIYPTVYPRPLFTNPLTANINRLVVNIRDMHAIGVDRFFAEFGCGSAMPVGFNELRMYLISALARDVKADVPALTKDFMTHYYGAAAPMMLKYLSELEKRELEEKNTLRWWPDHRSVLTYLTPANLLRWQKDFDEMEKLTVSDAKANMHVRRARINLDEATMSVWYKFKPGEMPDRDMMYKRYMRNVRDSVEELLAGLEPAKERRERIRRTIQWCERSMYYHYALAGSWRELPEKFAKLPEGSVKRTVPHINKKVLERNVPGSATGLAIKSTIPKTSPFVLFHWDGVRDTRDTFEPKFSLRRLKKAGEGKYDYYYIGTTRLYPDSMIATNELCYASGVMVGHLFDPASPEQRYDVYLSLKPEGETLWFDEVLLVKSDRPSTLVTKAPAGKGGKPQKSKKPVREQDADEQAGNL